MLADLPDEVARYQQEFDHIRGWPRGQRARPLKGGATFELRCGRCKPPAEPMPARPLRRRAHRFACNLSAMHRKTLEAWSGLSWALALSRSSPRILRYSAPPNFLPASP